jgi:hypothetical protein
MKIFIYIDSPDLEDIAEPIEAAIIAWEKDCDCTAQPVNAQDEATGKWTLGMTLDTGKKAVLKKALDFLYGLAKEYQVDFAVGFIDADTGAAHKVCYFGQEEGRPDISEIGSYLGLRR